MRKTNYKILGGDFYINGIKTYTDIEGSDEKSHGLLFNTRFIQENMTGLALNLMLKRIQKE